MNKIRGNIIRDILCFLWLLLAFSSPVFSQVDYGLIVRSIVSISGNGIGGEKVFATGFFVEDVGLNTLWLLTTAHSFESIKSDFAQIGIRRLLQNSIFKSHILQVQIRQNDKPLYFLHKHLDIAAIKVSLPGEVDYCVFSRESIADDSQQNKLSVNVGDSVLIFGYPYGIGVDNTGFAFARTGVISSYPIRPSRLYPVFYVDFEVFEGYSGSPIISRNNSSLLLGMVMEEVFLEELREVKGKKKLRRRRGLGLVKALNSALIKDFILTLR